MHLFERGCNEADGLYESHDVDRVGYDLVRSTTFEEMCRRSVTGGVHANDTKAQASPCGNLSRRHPGNLTPCNDNVYLVRSRFDVGRLVGTKHHTEGGGVSRVRDEPWLPLPR